MDHATERPRLSRYQADREASLRRGYRILFGAAVVAMTVTGLKFAMVTLFFRGLMRAPPMLSDFSLHVFTLCGYVLVGAALWLILALWRNSKWRWAAVGAWATGLVVTTAAFFGPQLLEDPLSAGTAIVGALVLAITLCRWFLEFDPPVT